MLTGKITKRIEIPHEPNEWLTIRMLSGKKIEEAREACERQVYTKLRALGPEALAAVRNANREEASNALAADPLAAYDLDIVLRSGVIGWSYDEPFAPAKTEELDEVTRRWAAREFIALSVPAEAEQKNA